MCEKLILDYARLLNVTASVTMASELVLPAPAMERVLSFLDARDLATMAQTCRTWQRIVYRKSVWAEKNITYRSAAFLVHTAVPPHARHLGTPSETCFLHWLQNIINIRMTGAYPLPVYIEHITDPAKFMKATHSYWISHRCPCHISEHHRLQDLLRITFPREFSKADKQRVLHRLIVSSERTTYNVYCHYLELLNRKLLSSPVLPPIGIIPDSSDPLHRLWLATEDMLRARFDAVNVAVSARYAKTNASFAALARHGHAEFETNDIWFTRERDGVWSTAGFSYKKSTA